MAGGFSMWVLRIQFGGRSIRVPVVKPLLVGRNPDCDVIVEAPGVSRRHCSVEPAPSGEGLWIRDLGSSLGLFLRDQPVKEVLLVEGDAVAVGRVWLFVQRDATLDWRDATGCLVRFPFTLEGKDLTSESEVPLRETVPLEGLDEALDALASAPPWGPRGGAPHRVGVLEMTHPTTHRARGRWAITPPARLTLFNGSPRGRKGNTALMLEQLALGFGQPAETYQLVRLRETESMVQAFSQAECVILGFPLYTDAMPAVVKHFIEALEPLTARGINPPLGFLVQSGFPEGLHSRYLERYLEKLAARLGSPYLGTIVKGNGEGTRVMPPPMTRDLFANLQSLGAGLASQGNLDPFLLNKVASPERYPAFLNPLFQVVVRLPVAHGYFDGMLKQNGAFTQRHAQPFLER
jgi:hypothetical protein